jgi:DNA-directed RNA polymerase subunit RPC12/RpoP
MSLDLSRLAGWQPPSNYQAVPSALEGITVYAPIPESPKEEEPTTYKCPQCGATTRFDIAAGGVACEHCGYTAPAQAQKVGVSAERSEFTLTTLSQAEKGWGLDRRMLHCDNCGAELSIPEGSLTSTCPFCASNKVNVRTAPAENLRPRFLVPFKIKSETIRSGVQAWLNKGWFYPSELSSSSVVDRLVGIYLSFWTFDADIASDWKAQVGYERQERFYDSSSKEWKSRTAIDWRWEDGSVNTSISNLLVPASTRVSRVILERLNPFNLNDLVTYSPDFLAGWQAQTYDITLPAAWEKGKASMRDKAKDACYDDIPTSHVRNFNMSADFSNEAWRYVLLPVYLASYAFQGKVYQVMANGQTGAIAGQKPVAWWKVWLAVAALMAPGLLLGLIGLILSVAGVGVLLLGVAFVLLIIGGVISIIIFKKAFDSEAA